MGILFSRVLSVLAHGGSVTPVQTVAKLRRTLALNKARYRHVERRMFPWCGMAEDEADIWIEGIWFQRQELLAAIRAVGRLAT